MRTMLKALITETALGVIIFHLAVFKSQCLWHTILNANAAVLTYGYRFGVVAILAVEIAALKKDRCAVARAID